MTCGLGDAMIDFFFSTNSTPSLCSLLLLLELSMLPRALLYRERGQSSDVRYWEMMGEEENRKDELAFFLFLSLLLSFHQAVDDVPGRQGKKCFFSSLARPLLKNLIRKSERKSRFSLSLSFSLVMPPPTRRRRHRAAVVTVVVTTLLLSLTAPRPASAQQEAVASTSSSTEASSLAASAVAAAAAGVPLAKPDYTVYKTRCVWCHRHREREIKEEKREDAEEREKNKER